MISALFLAEGLAQLGCGIGAGIGWAAVSVQVLQQLVQVWVLVRLVAALWTLSLVSQRLLVKSRQT